MRTPPGTVLASEVYPERRREDVLAGRVRWGPWSYKPTLRVLRHARYEIDLDKCTDSAAVLDWIVQVSKKTWASRACVGSLVCALDDLLNLQGTVCGRRVNKRIVPRAVLREQER